MFSDFQIFTPHPSPLKISRRDYIIQPGVGMTQERQCRKERLRRMGHKTNSILKELNQPRAGREMITREKNSQPSTLNHQLSTTNYFTAT
jgi:hypothetical protein